MIDDNKIQNNNYFFCGIKHSGKTTHAKIFAQNHNMEIFDGDDLILESLDGQKIRSFYKQNGKNAFMQKEFDSIKNFLSCNAKNSVLSLGGGVCDNNEAVKLLKSNGILIFIKVDENTLFKRIIKDGIPPFLEDNPKQKFHDLFEERDKKYLDFCDLVIEVKDGPIEQTASKIEAEIKKWIKNVT